MKNSKKRALILTTLMIASITTNPNCMIDQCKDCDYSDVYTCNMCEGGYYLVNFYGSEKRSTYQDCWSSMKLAWTLFSLILSAILLCCCCYTFYRLGSTVMKKQIQNSPYKNYSKKKPKKKSKNKAKGPVVFDDSNGSEITKATARFADQFSLPSHDFGSKAEVIHPQKTFNFLRKKPTLAEETEFDFPQTFGEQRAPRSTNVINNQVFGFTNGPTIPPKRRRLKPIYANGPGQFYGTNAFSQQNSVNNRAFSLPSGSQDSPSVRTMRNELSAGRHTQSADNKNLPFQIRDLIKQREMETGGSVKTFIVRANSKGGMRQFQGY
jgi:hypothetical protein